MPDSQNSDGPLELTLTVNGSPLTDTISVVSVDVVRAVNRVPSAKIVLRDGGAPGCGFAVSDGLEFVPGAIVAVSAGYGAARDVIFEGVVTTHSVRLGKKGMPRLILRCQDKAVAMTIGRRNATYVDQKDSEIFEKLIEDHGVKAEVDGTDVIHEELVQYYCSDWDFIVSRAEANGKLVSVDDGCVAVKAPCAALNPVMSVALGRDLVEFHADLDARMQFAEVEGAAWDIRDQATIAHTAGPRNLTCQGNLSGAKLAEVLGLDAFRLQTPAAIGGAALKAWTDGQQVKSALARIRGSMKIAGDARAKPGALIALDGVGQRFNGNVFVSAVHHRIRTGDWFTDVEFGLDPEWHAERRELAAPAAAGLLPGVDGLQIGLVQQLEADPEGHYRVRVAVPVMNGQSNPVWARLANFYGSKGAGAFFLPEVDDEVVLGFVNDDPSSPVILGSLYSSKKPAPYEPDDGNDTKAIVTRSGLSLVFDDNEKAVTMMTPGNNRIVLSDDGKTVLVEDQNGNKVELNSNGITLDCPREVRIRAGADIKLEAGGNIALDAGGTIGIAANAAVEVTGTNISQTANASFRAEGAASAELSASGQTTIKGAMVMIN